MNASNNHPSGQTALESPIRIAVLGNRESWYCDQLQAAATAAGHVCFRWDFSRLRSHVSSNGSRHVEVKGDEEEDQSIDAVIVRTMPPGTLEQVVYRMDALGQLQDSGTLVVNSPRSLECAIDKFLTSARLASSGLEVPDTVCCEDADDAMAAWEQLGRDVLVKPLFGSEGRGIVRVTDADLAWRTFRTIDRLGAVLYLQKFMENDGSDIRVLILGGEVLGAIRRTATEGFRTNIAQNGRAEVHAPTALECELAARAASVVGADFAGVDLMYSAGQLYVIEVNAVPGWRGFERATTKKVSRIFINWIARAVQDARNTADSDIADSDMAEKPATVNPPIVNPATT